MTLRAAAAALAFSVLAVGLLSGAQVYLDTMHGVVSLPDRSADGVSVGR